MCKDRIIIDLAVRHRKPIIKGAGIPVELILSFLAVGIKMKEISKSMT